MEFPVERAAAPASHIDIILQNISQISESKDLVSFWGIDGELKRLQKILKYIKDVLNDAERRSQNKESVIDWMKDLSGLLYCIEVFVDDMDIERVRAEKQLAPMNSPSPGHQAASKYTIWDIMADYISQKKTISESIKKILGELDKVADDAKKLNLKQQTSGGAPVAIFAVRNGDDIGPLVDESEIYGRQEDKDRVIELLMSPNDSSNNYSVVSIVGMGGVGKTTLAQLVFQDERVQSYFDMQSWACVSVVFDSVRVLRELIEYANKGNTSNTTCAALFQDLKNIVDKKKVLVVLDDMWEAKAYDKLKLVFTGCAKGSKILVTARDKKIGQSIDDNEFYELQRLKDEHCRVLFNKAFGRSVVTEKLDSKETRIVERCKGVPLAIKVIGSSLRVASDHMRESILENKIWQSMDKAKDGILQILGLSYDYLPSHLKRCFLYFSLFPTDYRFRRNNLVNLWIAEGLVVSSDNKKLVDIGCSYYIELQRRCLIQEDNRMHDHLHHLARSRSAKFFSCSSQDSESVSQLESIRHLSFIGVKVEKLDQAKCLRTLLVFESRLLDKINLECTLLRVLDLTGNEFRELPSSVGNLRYLRYLNLSSCSKLKKLPDSICDLHLLQILDLSYCHGMSGTALPAKMENLQNLRYLCLYQMEHLSALPSSIVKLSNLLTLDLRWCGKLDCIPNNIGGLRSLQILGLTGCRSLSHLPSEIGDLQDLRELQLGLSSVSCLPESICNIRNLRVLDISNCKRLTSLPYKIGNLTCIKKLDRFFVGREEGHGIEELKDMNELQGKLAILNLENVRNVEHALRADLKKKKLDEIHLKWTIEKKYWFSRGAYQVKAHDDSKYDKSDSVERELQVKVLDALEPHPTSLKTLSFLNYHGGRIPKWMSALSFPVLKELVMTGLEWICEMVDLELPSLESLQIESCLELRKVSMGVPNLKALQVSSCRYLTTLSMSSSLGNSSSSLASSRMDLPRLEGLRGCSSLRDILMMQPISLTELHVSVRDHERISLAIPLDLLLTKEGGRMYPNLVRLDVKGCPQLKFIPEGLRHLMSLEHINFSCQLGKGEVASLQNLSRLEDMVIRGFAGQVLPLAGDDDSGSTSNSLPLELKYLAIRDCPNLTILPKDLHACASLQRLIISDCPELVSFPETGLPPLLQELCVSSCKNLRYLPTSLNDHAKLKYLAIRDCPNLTILPKDLHACASLQRMTISDCPELVSFPETGLPPLLETLHIFSCKNLQYLPTGLGGHTSLQYVFIRNCDQLEAQPDDPPNFSFLHVSKCPKLEQQIKQHRKD